MLEILGSLQDDSVAVDLIKELGAVIMDSRIYSAELAQFIRREKYSYCVLHWRSLEHILSNRWFGRVLIVQGVTVASRSVFIYQNKSVDWESLKGLMHSFTRQIWQQFLVLRDRVAERLWKT
ncbi:hypothetical protein B0O99DRAFT_236360 [Bisporella sp. PMI_857]|nr:hypothetical protein B0O99DRAFT_236360 [Bisporella sp. PMI_857]